MNLTGEQYAKLLQTLRSAPADELATPDRMRMAYCRHGGGDYRTRIQIRACAPARRMGNQWVTVAVHNFSPRGMCVHTEVGLPPGDQLIARIIGQDAQSQDILCTVVNCGPVANGVFSIGCEFVRMMSPAVHAVSVN